MYLFCARHSTYKIETHILFVNELRYRCGILWETDSDTETISRKQRLVMAAPAQWILIQRLSPNCNIISSFIQSSYTATDIRKKIDWLASYEKTDVSWRILEVGEGLWGKNSFQQERARQGRAATVPTY